VREGCRVVLLARSVEYIESLAAELNGNHQCDTVRAIRCDQGLAEDADRDPEMNPDAIADVYWQLVRQVLSAWTLELDLRPNREKFFE
jgi:hypothetical protein